MNLVILANARLVRDPELKTVGDNFNICEFTVAVKRNYQKQGEEEKSDFIRCKVLGKRAEIISKYFQKGSVITIKNGEIQTGSYEKDGKPVYTTEVIVNDFEFPLGNPKKDGNTTAQSAPATKTEPSKKDGSTGFSIDDTEDDLPF